MFRPVGIGGSFEVAPAETWSARVECGHKRECRRQSNSLEIRERIGLPLVGSVVRRTADRTDLRPEHGLDDQPPRLLGRAADLGLGSRTWHRRRLSAHAPRTSV